MSLNVGKLVSELRRTSVAELRRKYAEVHGEQTRSHHKEYRTIVSVAERIPDSVLQEDEKLLMYYDVARMRLGNDSDDAGLF
jgi:hypothetical protein